MKKIFLVASLVVAGTSFPCMCSMATDDTQAPQTESTSLKELVQTSEATAHPSGVATPRRIIRTFSGYVSDWNSSSLYRPAQLGLTWANGNAHHAQPALTWDGNKR